MARVTIGVPIYNCANNVKNLILGIRATTTGSDGVAEVVVYDDGSPNRSVSEEAEAFCHEHGAVFLRGDVNRGVPAAFNPIAERSTGEIVLLTNDDVRPTTSGWL